MGYIKGIMGCIGGVLVAFWLAGDLLNKVTAGRSPYLRGRET